MGKDYDDTIYVYPLDIDSTDPHEMLVRLWSARLLVDGNGPRLLVSGNEGRIQFFEISEFCGVGISDKWPGSKERGPSVSDVRNVLQHNLEMFYARLDREPEPITTNIRALGARLRLNDVEQQVLLFLALMHQAKPLEEVFSLAASGVGTRVEEVIAKALQVDSDAVAAALSRGGLLLRTGLVQCREDRSPDTREDRYSLLEGLWEGLTCAVTDLETIFRRFFQPSLGTSLSVEDVPHLLPDMERIETVLRRCQQDRRQGVNVLLYGPPGTGKTEFARLLASRLDASLQEISWLDAAGEAKKPGDRVVAWKLCQEMLGRDSRALILFDEVEDVFSESRYGAGKAWMNHLLEQNETPTIWIANNLKHFDESYLRRFTVVQRITTPPAHVRLGIARRCCEGADLPDDWQRLVSRHPNVTPAQLSQVAELSMMTKGDLGAAEREAFLTQQLNRHLELQHQRPLPPPEVEYLPWRPDFLEADYPLDSLFDGLRETQRGTILLYGPPGGGKTAFAKTLATHLGAPVMSYAASELLNPFVGMTERGIADMFRQAEEQGGVLLLDEADSLLRNRKEADASWEVTQVNELLMRMEAYRGVFVCATNLMDIVDDAALRRFDVRVCLDYVRPERASALFEHLLSAVGLPRPDGAQARNASERLARLENLVPGDFATVARRHHRLGQPTTTDGVLVALEEESRVKAGGTKRRVGFV